ncbi:DUF1269 domain-containing protein [Microlunatus ginsengisoli]|uniref:DUF1269 domain-containing protein n=1 Tax=Microlunatus ginsengisoli TaxID=363863 RepID=A0ABP7AID6_9ACTN
MATLTVWAFPDAAGADRAIERLNALQGQALITIEDAAVVSWEVGKKKPKTRQFRQQARGGALGGAFWGLLFGLLFLLPLLGAAIGAGMGALAARFTDFGIDDDFITQVRGQVTPGTSALFLLSTDVVRDRVHEEFADTRPTLITSNLSSEQEAKLRETFGEE